MTTFKEFINEGDDPFQAFLKMRQAQGWNPNMKASISGDEPSHGDPTPPPAPRAMNPALTRLSHEVQSGHQTGGIVSKAVLQLAAKNNKGSLSGLISPDRLKAQQAYPFIQQRRAGRDVPGVVEYNNMFPLASLLKMLGLG